MKEQLKVSSLQDFKKKQEEASKGIPHLLPSGLVMKIKKPSARLLLVKGLVDDKFFRLGIKTLQADNNEFTEALITEMPYLIDRCKKLVLELSVFPRFVEGNADESKEELPIEAMSEEDLLSFIGLIPMAFAEADVSNNGLPVEDVKKKQNSKSKNSKNSLKQKKQTS